MKLYNTASKSLEEFEPLKAGKVGIYSCGPTVYWNQHIGHMYAYVQWDLLVRYLRYKGFDVTWVMNITDVGHLTSDEDTGEDKMAKGAAREGISVWDLADKYTKQFIESMNLLNITAPDKLVKATDHIDDQIKLASTIQKNGFAYETDKGLVFNSSKFSDYAKFANLKLDKQQKRDDVASDPNKKKPWDFFLWVKDPNHVMVWDSPWGRGYPGWHIECTAMSTRYLGDEFDIHTGGLEHIPVHHTNEIAQGYGAFGHSTARYWLHNAHLLGKGGVKMSKSLGNFVTPAELVNKGYDPLALRYLFLTSNYRKGLNFSWRSLDAAVNGLSKLRSLYSNLDKSINKSFDKSKLIKKFDTAMDEDLNTSEALAVVWEVFRSDLAGGDKRELASKFDSVLGLKLNDKSPSIIIPEKVIKLAEQRQALRQMKEFSESDEVRMKIEKLGYRVKDTSKGFVISKR